MLLSALTVFASVVTLRVSMADPRVNTPPHWLSRCAQTVGYGLNITEPVIAVTVSTSSTSEVKDKLPQVTSQSSLHYHHLLSNVHHQQRVEQRAAVMQTALNMDPIIGLSQKQVTVFLLIY